MGIFFASRAALLGYSVKIVNNRTGKIARLYDNGHGGYCLHSRINTADTYTIKTLVLSSGTEFEYKIAIVGGEIKSRFDGYNL